jgi:hypothetical protein
VCAWRAGEAYLDVAELVLEEPDRLEVPGVSAGFALLAGIAASDSICARRLGQLHGGEDHRAAAALVGQATPDGKKLAATLVRLIDLKDEAHYGVLTISSQRAATPSLSVTVDLRGRVVRSAVPINPSDAGKLTHSRISRA